MSKNTKKISFPAALRKALLNCWETVPKFSRNYAKISLKPLAKGKYSLAISGVNGNGYTDASSVVKLNVHVHMQVIPAKKGHKKNVPPKMVLTMPSLYGSLNKFYESYNLSKTLDPIAHATSLLAFLADRVKDVNAGRHVLPGKHKAIKFYTDCDKFKMVADRSNVKVAPLSGQPSFNFGTECMLNRDYIINSICQIINFEAYLYHDAKSYFNTQVHMKTFLKSMNG